MALTLVVIDSVVGAALYQTDTTAQVTVIPPNEGKARRAIVVLPGYLMSGRLVGQAFKPFVAGTDVLVSVDYAQRGVDTTAIYRDTMSALRSAAPAEVVFYGASMGGMVAAELIRQYHADGAPFGRATLVLDTAPAAFADVKRPEWLLKVACWYKGGPLSSVIWAAVTAVGERPPSEVGADPELVRRANRSGIWVGTAAVASQGCFIGHFALDEADTAAGPVTPVFYLHGSSSDADPLIEITTATNRWRDTFPSLRDVPVKGRNGGWHIPLVERPAETVAAILGALESK